MSIDFTKIWVFFFLKIFNSKKIILKKQNLEKSSKMYRKSNFDKTLNVKRLQNIGFLAKKK